MAEEASIGLVVFSDVPYELLPPGTPAEELRPFLRLLVAPRIGPVQNPWTQSFRAGTRISVALDLAKSALERDEVAAGSILLVSDLETAPDDVPSLAGKIADIGRAGIRLRVVAARAVERRPAACSRDSSRRTRSVASRRSLRTPSEPRVAVTAAVELPTALLVLGALALLLPRGPRAFAGRLALPARAAEEGAS